MDNLFKENNPTNQFWQNKLSECYNCPNVISSPRGMEVRELINGSYKVPMPAFLDLAERRVVVPFMFAEAAWIISGSNRLSWLTKYMKTYANFSDDGVFLRGAYGPKFVDQLPYIVQSLVDDNDTRQAVATLWRERPGPSKDIPCTVAIQFMIRNDVLHMVTTMRSNDIVLGFTYDIFTFSMMANAVRLLLKQRGVDVVLGDLHVNAGSLHIYKRHYKDVKRWVDASERDMTASYLVTNIMKVESYEELIDKLLQNAYVAKKAKEDAS